MNTWEFPNFSEKEFACRHCGKCEMDLDFVAKLQELRSKVDLPMKISSGYGCKDHPVEAKKSAPGTHNEGVAADILCFGSNAHKILSMALELKFQGIGVNMKGDRNSRFIHLDMSKKKSRPTIWSY